MLIKYSRHCNYEPGVSNMPHFIVEYSANLETRIDLQSLADHVRDAAVATGVFPLGGIRVRMHPSTVYTIADGNRDAAFVHIQLRMGYGRDLPTRERAGESVFAALTRFLDSQFEQYPFALSFEIVEIDPVLTYKKNNIHHFLNS